MPCNVKTQSLVRPGMVCKFSGSLGGMISVCERPAPARRRPTAAVVAGALQLNLRWAGQGGAGRGLMLVTEVL